MCRFWDGGIKPSTLRQAVIYSLETFDDLKVPKIRVSEYSMYPDILPVNKTVILLVFEI